MALSRSLAPRDKQEPVPESDGGGVTDAVPARQVEVERETVPSERADSTISMSMHSRSPAPFIIASAVGSQVSSSQVSSQVETETRLEAEAEAEAEAEGDLGRVVTGSGTASLRHSQLSAASAVGSERREGEREVVVIDHQQSPGERERERKAPSTPAQDPMLLLRPILEALTNCTQEMQKIQASVEAVTDRVASLEEKVSQAQNQARDAERHTSETLDTFRSDHSAIRAEMERVQMQRTRLGELAGALNTSRLSSDVAGVIRKVQLGGV
ncbi:hypothetical protein KIPB_011222 [Kipferlia bialata]|uniref:Uncharacterized protein n=1 Tax=Kipferlia bialata TaxID=797122 RepID=A0A9K3GM50_9EUKA|nr:hypothetical protein KIPB_011222 [Kipferlia bialata]|eukprot:g11222.t1